MKDNIQNRSLPRHDKPGKPAVVVSEPIITDRTRALAQRSVNCVVCQRARRQQAGLAFWVVKTFEGLCPFCRAYEKVNGRKSHEPVPGVPSTAPAGSKTR